MTSKKLDLSPINGLILSGGKSSRMGKDKALLNYHGTSQLAHLTILLKPFCDRVYVSAKYITEYPNHNIIEDQYHMDSPLNGILSALTSYPENAWLVIACDMPFIDTQSIEFLMSYRSLDKLATCYINQKNIIEPLFSIWEPDAQEQLQSFQSNDGLSPRKFLIDNHVNLVKPLDHKVLMNVNTLEEFEHNKKNYNM